MPKVPRIKPQVETRPAPGPRISPSASLEAFGGGESADAVGKASTKLLVTASKIIAIEKQRADELAVQDVVLLATNLKTDIEVRAKEMLGKDAMGAQEFAQGEWRKGLSKINEGLSNNRQKSTASKRFGVLSASLYKSIENHSAAERYKYDTAQTEEYLAAVRRDASKNYLDLELVSAARFQQQSALMKYAARNGLPDEWLENKLGDTISKTHVDTLTRMLADGNEEMADKYAEEFKDEIRTNDLQILKKVKKEIAQAQAEAADTAQRERHLALVNGAIDIHQADALLRGGEIDVPEYNRMRSRILKVNDDPAISNEAKTSKFFELLEEFTSLRGGKQDEQNRIIQRAKNNDLKTLRAFRDKVSSFADHLTKKQEQDFYLYTQRDFEHARAGKIGWLEHLSRWANNNVNLQLLFEGDHALSRAMDIFDGSVSLEDAVVQIESIKQEANVAMNPDQMKMVKGEIYDVDGAGPVKIFGHDEFGRAIIEVPE